MKCWGGENDDDIRESNDEDEEEFRQRNEEAERTIYLDTKHGDDRNSGRRGEPIQSFEELLRRLAKRENLSN